MIPEIPKGASPEKNSNPQNLEMVPASKPFDIFKKRFEFLKSDPDSAYSNIYSNDLNKADIEMQKGIHQ